MEIRANADLQLLSGLLRDLAEHNAREMTLEPEYVSRLLAQYKGAGFHWIREGRDAWDDIVSLCERFTDQALPWEIDCEEFASLTASVFAMAGASVDAGIVRTGPAMAHAVLRVTESGPIGIPTGVYDPAAGADMPGGFLKSYRDAYWTSVSSLKGEKAMNAFLAGIALGGAVLSGLAAKGTDIVADLVTKTKVPDNLQPDDDDITTSGQDDDDTLEKVVSVLNPLSNPGKLDEKNAAIKNRDKTIKELKAKLATEKKTSSKADANYKFEAARRQKAEDKLTSAEKQLKASKAAQKAAEAAKVEIQRQLTATRAQLQKKLAATPQGQARQDIASYIGQIDNAYSTAESPQFVEQLSTQFDEDPMSVFSVFDQLATSGAAIAAGEESNEIETGGKGACDAKECGGSTDTPCSCEKLIPMLTGGPVFYELEAGYDNTECPSGACGTAGIRVHDTRGVDGPMGLETFDIAYNSDGPMGFGAMGLETDTEGPMGFETEGPMGFDTTGLETDTEGPMGFETEGPMGFDTMGLETDTEGPMGFETEGPMGFETEGPMGFETEGPMGFDTMGLETDTEGPMGFETEGPMGFDTMGLETDTEGPMGFDAMGDDGLIPLMASLVSP